MVEIINVVFGHGCFY